MEQLGWQERWAPSECPSRVSISHSGCEQYRVTSCHRSKSWTNYFWEGIQSCVRSGIFHRWRFWTASYSCSQTSHSSRRCSGVTTNPWTFRCWKFELTFTTEYSASKWSAGCWIWLSRSQSGLVYLQVRRDGGANHRRTPQRATQPRKCIQAETYHSWAVHSWLEWSGLLWKTSAIGRADKVLCAFVQRALRQRL